MPRILQNHHVLAVHDARASARFFVEVLGFEVTAEPEGWVFVSRDSCMVMLGECPDDLHPSALGCHNYFGYFVVDDADGYHAQVKAAGAQPISEPAYKPWGMREFAVRTPEGHRITIGQRIGA